MPYLEYSLFSTVLMKFQAISLKEQACVAHNHRKILLSQGEKIYTTKYAFSTLKAKINKKGVAWPDYNVCSVPALDAPACNSACFL